MSRFIPFMDKENSELGVLAQPRGLGPRSAPVGKTFQPGVHHVTPMPGRRALGDRNSRDMTGGGLLQKHPASKIPVSTRCLNPPEPAGKPKVNKTNRQKHDLKDPQEIVVEAEEEFPPIEHMPVPIEEEDTYDDVWSRATRPDTYIEEIKTWRPSQVFPSRKWETHRTSLDDYFLRGDADSSFENYRIQDLTAEEVDVDLLWENNVDTRRVAAIAPLEDLYDEQEAINGFSLL